MEGENKSPQEQNKKPEEPQPLTQTGKEAVEKKAEELEETGK